MSITTIKKLTATPFITTIPSGQWQGSDGDWYIRVEASNITTDSILVPSFDNASASLFTGTKLWCTTNTGYFFIHVDSKPSGDVTILVQFMGVVGEANYQVLSDVYSKNQTDNLIAQSTADVNLNVTGTTFSDLYEILSNIPSTGSASIFMATDAASVLSNGVIKAGGTAIVSRFNNGATFSFMLISNDTSGVSNVIYTWRVTGWTSVNATPTVESISKYRRSALETVSVSIPSDAADSIDEIQLRVNGYMAILRVTMKSEVSSGATITTLSLGNYAPPMLITGSCYATTVNDSAKVFRARLETTGRFTFQASASSTNTVTCTFIYPLNQ